MRGARLAAAGALAALVVLCLAWELWLAPLRPGGSLLALKALPLVLPLNGVLRGRRYTCQWSSMLILAYFTEGVVRAWSDVATASRLAAGAEVALSVLYVAAAVSCVRATRPALPRAGAGD